MLKSFLYFANFVVLGALSCLAAFIAPLINSVVDSQNWDGIYLLGAAACFICVCLIAFISLDNDSMVTEKGSRLIVPIALTQYLLSATFSLWILWSGNLSGWLLLSLPLTVFAIVISFLASGALFRSNRYKKREEFISHFGFDPSLISQKEYTADALMYLLKASRKIFSKGENYAGSHEYKYYQGILELFQYFHPTLGQNIPHWSKLREFIKNWLMNNFNEAEARQYPTDEKSSETQNLILLHKQS